MLEEFKNEIQKSEEWIKAWKGFIEKTRPVHHFGTLTFKTAPHWATALKKFRKFMLKNVCRPERQHLFIWYVYDKQPHRNHRGEDVYHIHYVMGFEGEPLNPKVIERMWNRNPSRGNAKIDWYNSSLNGITYNYSKHLHYDMEALCHNKIEQHKNHGCPYRINHSLWLEKT